MTEPHWWTLYNGTTILYVEWGEAHGTVFGTDFKMSKGPPVTLSLNLDRNFRASSATSGTFRDAQALAQGGVRDLRLVQISDEQISLGLHFLLEQLDDTSPPWRLLLNVRGDMHVVDVDPEFRAVGSEHELLLLRARRSQ